MKIWCAIFIVGIWAITELSVVAQAQNFPEGSAVANGDKPAHDGNEAKQASDLELEQLVNTDVIVTSASKKSESLFQAPAAIYLLTGEDIRRGGFSTLPEALRMVPGLYVAQAASHIWQVSTRGFGDLNNNKMLVLVDGRSAYSPELGSVFWDVLDIPLENIDRVEVIRGPGGTLWGADAVNGVINIVTKRADQVQGALVSISADPEAGSGTTVRYGGRVSQGLSYYVYGRTYYGEPLRSSSGLDNSDHFALSQAGARVDWSISGNDTLSLEGGSADGRFLSNLLNTVAPTSSLLKDNNVLLRWGHTISSRSTTDTLAYCNWHARLGAPGELRNTCSVEFQHNYQFNERQSLIWGGEFFTTGDDLSPDAAKYVPERRRDNVISGFAQYDVMLLPGRLRLIGGSKFEHNDYTGFEYQPQVRGVWTPGKSHTVWASFSRAVRVPTRNNSDLQLVLPAGEQEGKPLFVEFDGDPTLTSEYIRAYEAGYRYQISQSISTDAAFYYNNYQHVIVSADPVPEIFPDRIVLRSPFINGADAQTHGAELSAKWNPIADWAIVAGITELRGSPSTLQGSPEHIFNIQLHANLPHRTEFNLALYHSGTVSLADGQVAQFNRVDTGISWHLNSQWTFSVWGRNLQTAQHTETHTTFGDPVGYVPRSVAFAMVWRSQPEPQSSH